MKRALFVANVDSFHRHFHIPYIKLLAENGYNVDLASNGTEQFEYCNNKYNIPFARVPLKMQNIIAYNALKKIITDNHYDLVYCNTPVSGSIARLASKEMRKKGTRVIYSAHGFSFYKGQLEIQNFKYIVAEKILSGFTDCIITMNQEDYDACKFYKFKCKEIKSVDGVGIDNNRFCKLNRSEKNKLRDKYGFNEIDLILIYPAELTERKNQGMLIDIVNELVRQIPQVKLLLVGAGHMEDLYKLKVNELRLQNNIHFLGYRSDVPELLGLSDILVASSLNEGLPINIIEAMASGLPVVATKVRGHIDLIRDRENGCLFELSDIYGAVGIIEQLHNDKNFYEMLSTNAQTASQKYDIKEVLPQYKDIFGLDITEI